jgi:hypothetical protein
MEESDYEENESLLRKISLFTSLDKFINLFVTFHKEMTTEFLSINTFSDCDFCAKANTIAKKNSAFILGDIYEEIHPQIEAVIKALVKLPNFEPCYLVITFVYYKRVIDMHKQCNSTGIMLANHIYIIALCMICCKIFSDYIYTYDTLIAHLREHRVCITQAALCKAEFSMFDMIKHNYSLRPEELAYVMAKTNII